MMTDFFAGERAGQHHEFIHASAQAAVLRPVRVFDVPIADLYGTEHDWQASCRRKLLSRPPHLKRSERGSASGREGLAGNRWLYSAPFYWTTECYWALDEAVECVSMALNSVSAMVSMPLSLG